MRSYVAGAWAVELESEPPLFSWLRPKRAAPAPQHWMWHGAATTVIIFQWCGSRSGRIRTFLPDPDTMKLPGDNFFGESYLRRKPVLLYRKTVLRSRSRYFLVEAGVKMWRQKHVFLLLFSLFLYEKEPEPVKKVPGAGAGQKRTGSATLLKKSPQVWPKMKNKSNLLPGFWSRPVLGWLRLREFSTRSWNFFKRLRIV